MNISPIRAQASQNIYTGNPPVKPLTKELESVPIRMKSSHMTDIPENIVLSNQAVRSIGFSLDLTRNMRQQNIEGTSSGDGLKDLAQAYNDVKANLNDGNENSNKHGKFLDDAFKNLSRSFFFLETSRQHSQNIDLTAPPSTVEELAEASAAFKRDQAEAMKKSALFSDSFIKNFKKMGLEEAFETAMSLIK